MLTLQSVRAQANKLIYIDCFNSDEAALVAVEGALYNDLETPLKVWSVSLKQNNCF